MSLRVAAIFAILAFAGCLIVGEFHAGNPFATNVLRALAAMAGTFVVGLIVGAAGERLLRENIAQTAQASEKKSQKPTLGDR